MLGRRHDSRLAEGSPVEPEGYQLAMPKIHVIPQENAGRFRRIPEGRNRATLRARADAGLKFLATD